MTVWGFKRVADPRWLTVCPSARHRGCLSHWIARVPQMGEAETSCPEGPPQWLLDGENRPRDFLGDGGIVQCGSHRIETDGR